MGGERPGLQRLYSYFWQKDLLKRYKQTRNGLLGDYSSKFSVWLAHGCLSPREIHAQVHRYERQRTKNQSTYWLVFELIWRDFFRFAFLKHGNRFFHAQGIADRAPYARWSKSRFLAWTRGETGVPFVDANMIELRKTGFMSNRGRQNVASFLVHDLHLPWRAGAAWFEHLLLDYDVQSNWGNWAYVAGVGNDPRPNRKFKILRQAEKYDAKGHYVRTWLPELEHLPNEHVHAPHAMKDPPLPDGNIYRGPLVDLVEADMGNIR
jgi:deoxyribodipyrimidine photo-lyase